MGWRDIFATAPDKSAEPTQNAQNSSGGRVFEDIEDESSRSHAAQQTLPSEDLEESVSHPWTGEFAEALVRIADAIAMSPRSPFFNDLALSRAAHATVEGARIVSMLPEVARREALSLCAQVSRQAADAIRRRDYERAFQVLDALPDELKTLTPQ